MLLGLLTPDAPLRSVFTDHVVPLMSATTICARLGDETTPQECYLLDLGPCTVKQCDGMAELMEQLGQGTAAEAMDYIRYAPVIPIRKRYISKTVTR